MAYMVLDDVALRPPIALYFSITRSVVQPHLLLVVPLKYLHTFARRTSHILFSFVWVSPRTPILTHLF